MRYVISSSYGNDSMAMIQWAHEQKLSNLTVTYIDTGWAADRWMERVEAGEAFARRCGFEVVRIQPVVQFEELMMSRKGFPNQKYQWCSANLKGFPFLHWIDEADPECHAMVMVGKRRAESEARKNTAPFIMESEYHGGRMLLHPLFEHSDEQRNELLARAGFEPLPHRSLECDPCINSNRADFRRLSLADIQKTAELEVDVGKTMFRPARHNGAKGIWQVIEWAKYSRGQYDPSQEDMFATGCGSPFGCGL